MPCERDGVGERVLWDLARRFRVGGGRPEPGEYHVLVVHALDEPGVVPLLECDLVEFRVVRVRGDLTNAVTREVLAQFTRPELVGEQAVRLDRDPLVSRGCTGRSIIAHLPRNFGQRTAGVFVPRV